LITTNTELLSKQKYKHLFDAAFVSSRHTAMLSETEKFASLYKPKASGQQTPQLLAIETLKYIIPVTHADTRKTYIDKVTEYSTAIGFAPCSGKNSFFSFLSFDLLFCRNNILTPHLRESPVFIRKRDEKDLESDVIFFTK
jgi:hypothetical protein